MRENRTTYSEWSRVMGQILGLFLGLLLCVPASLAAQGSGQPASLADLQERAVTAGISESRLSELVERASSRQLGEMDMVQLLTPAVEMAEQGLPGEMIVQKAMEGMAKGIPPAMLNQVLNRIRQGAEQSVPIVDRWMERPEVGQMLERSGSRGNRDRFRQNMVRMGARASLESPDGSAIDEILSSLSEPQLLERATPGQIVAAATIMSDLPASTGMPISQASQMVARAVQNGFSSSDLQRLPAAMNMAQRRSQLPAASVLEGVGEQMDRGIPAADILQNLFNGDIGGGGPPGHTPPGLESRPDRDENHPGRGVSGPPGEGPPVTPPGRDGDLPGQGNDGPPGQDGTPPGQGGDGPPNGPPGQDGTPPSQGNDGPPNNPPGQSEGPPNGRGPVR